MADAQDRPRPSPRTSHVANELTAGSGSAPLRLQTAYARILANLVGVIAALIAIAFVQFSRNPPAPQPPAALPAQVPAALVMPPPAPAARIRPAEPAPTPAQSEPTLDREAVAAGEARVEAARRDRARAESRLADAEASAASAAARSASRALAARSLPSRVRDPSARITRATNRLAVLSADGERLKAELAALEHAPRPKGKPLIDKSPVARPADGEEFHFELRRERVTPIDLERLLGQVKVDARIRFRRAEGNTPTIDGHVGPIGAFTMSYRLGRTGDVFDVMGGNYGLQAWEIVPESDARGESYDVAVRPLSDFNRAVGRLNPERATVTLWVYADSFAIYRKLRDDLHARGFQVAARPMPVGLAIRGSLAGTVSAGQ